MVGSFFLPMPGGVFLREFPHPVVPGAVTLRGTPHPLVPGAGILRVSPHPVPLPFMLRGFPRLPLPGAFFCGCPRTPSPVVYAAGHPALLSCRGRCQNWPDGVAGGGYSAGNPAPSRAANAAKIGLTGLPEAVTLREPPPPPAPRALFFSLLALAGVAL